MFAVETEPVLSVNRRPTLAAVPAAEPVFTAGTATTASESLTVWLYPADDAPACTFADPRDGTFCANNPVNMTDPLGLLSLRQAGWLAIYAFGSGLLAMVAPADAIAAGCMLVVGGTTGILHSDSGPYALTLSGTPFTFYGTSYERLGQAARSIIESHEYLHQLGYGELTAYESSLHDIDLILARGKYGEFLGEGGTDLTECDRKQLTSLRYEAAVQMQFYSMGFVDRQRTRLQNLRQAILGM